MKSEPKKKLAVITVGYNNYPFLEEYFSTLKASTYQDFTVIFIDNNSSDDTAQFIKENYPETTLIVEKENLGFAGGNNKGIDLALAQEFEYALLLNPDTALDPHCLELLMAEAAPTSVLQPLILLDRNGRTDLVNTSGNELSYLGFSYCGGYEEKMETFKGITKKPITLASGAAMVIPCDALRKVGAFDPTYFMYAEDMDLNWHLRQVGLDAFVVPQAHIWHKYSFSRNSRKFYYAERNRLLFIATNFGWPLLILSLPFHIINELLLVAYSILGGWLGAKLKGYVDLVGLLPHIFRQRRIIQKRRTRSDHELKNLLSAKIAFGEVKIPALDLYNLFVHWYWVAIRWLI